MTFSPDLEAKFAKLLESYPTGRTRSAVIPMLLFAQDELGLGHKEVAADGQFSLEEVECIGACSWAPAIEINYDFHHFVTPEKLDQLIDGLRKAQ